MDWEFVGRQGAGNNIVSTSDAANYLLFLKTLRTTIGTGYLITGAVPAAGCAALRPSLSKVLANSSLPFSRSFTGADGAILTDVSGFALYFDYLTLMAYVSTRALLDSNRRSFEVILLDGLFSPPTRYDYYGSWSSSTGPNAALNTCNSGSDSAAATIARWEGWVGLALSQTSKMRY